MDREDWGKWVRVFGALLIVAFLATLLTYALVDANAEYEYDVAYSLDDGHQLGPFTGSSGAAATNALPFTSNPYRVELSLSWTPTFAGPSAETMTIAIVDPSGSVVASGSGTSGSATVSADLAAVPANSGPHTERGMDNVEEAGMDAADGVGPATSGWVVRVTRATLLDPLPETPDTDWSVSGMWNGIDSEAINVDEVTEGRGTTTLIVASITFGIALLYGIVLLIMYLIWSSKNVEGWDRTSGHTSRLALGQRENDARRKF